MHEITGGNSRNFLGPETDKYFVIIFYFRYNILVVSFSTLGYNVYLYPKIKDYNRKFCVHCKMEYSLSFGNEYLIFSFQFTSQ